MGVSETAVIIAAAGSSHRMGAGLPKQYRIVEALPVLIKTVKAFCHCGKFAQIIIAAPPGDTDYVSSLLAEYGVEGCAVTAGGATRPESVMNALALVNARYVMVHDGARPFVSAEVIGRVQQALDKGAKAVIPCVRPKNTIRTADATLDRSTLYEVQTPQGFETEVLRKAYDKAFAKDNDTGRSAKRGGAGAHGLRLRRAQAGARKAADDRLRARALRKRPARPQRRRRALARPG